MSRPGRIINKACLGVSLKSQRFFRILRRIRHSQKTPGTSANICSNVWHNQKSNCSFMWFWKNQHILAHLSPSGSSSGIPSWERGWTCLPQVSTVILPVLGFDSMVVVLFHFTLSFTKPKSFSSPFTCGDISVHKQPYFPFCGKPFHHLWAALELWIQILTF